MITAGITTAFNAHTAVTVQATMEFEAGQPFEGDAAALATDPWISMYPG
jgi:hypothetical protein